MTFAESNYNAGSSSRGAGDTSTRPIQPFGYPLAAGLVGHVLRESTARKPRRSAGNARWLRRFYIHGASAVDGSVSANRAAQVGSGSLGNGSNLYFPQGRMTDHRDQPDALPLEGRDAK